MILKIELCRIDSVSCVGSVWVDRLRLIKRDGFGAKSELFPFFEKLHLPIEVDFVFHVHTTVTDPFGAALLKNVDSSPQMT